MQDGYTVNTTEYETPSQTILNLAKAVERIIDAAGSGLIIKELLATIAMLNKRIAAEEESN